MQQGEADVESGKNAAAAADMKGLAAYINADIPTIEVPSTASISQGWADIAKLVGSCGGAFTFAAAAMAATGGVGEGAALMAPAIFQTANGVFSTLIGLANGVACVQAIGSSTSGGAWNADEAAALQGLANSVLSDMSSPAILKWESAPGGYAIASDIFTKNFGGAKLSAADNQGLSNALREGLVLNTRSTHHS